MRSIVSRTRRLTICGAISWSLLLDGRNQRRNKMGCVKNLGGKNGTLKCSKCGKPRYPNQGTTLCPDCWGEENPGHGTRNRGGVVIQQRLSPELWKATQFAADMVHRRTPLFKAIRIAAGYYHCSFDEVQRAMSQRSGRNKKRAVRSSNPGFQGTPGTAYPAKPCSPS